jgi:hypothetical protein
MDALNERQAVAQFLNGKTIAFGAEIAREAIGRSYTQMDRPAWARLAGHVLSCGWRKGRVDGHPVWMKPEPAQPALAL